MADSPPSAQRILRELLADVAAPTPAPGAGSASAWVTALAAGLAEMAAALTLTRDDYASLHARMTAIRDRAARLRAGALELAEQELRSYAPVLEAQRLPREDPSRAARLDAALSDAADAPLAIARAAGEVAELAAELTRAGNRSLEGDANAGALLAGAACRAAARLVDLNLARRPDDPRRAEAAELAERAARA